MVLSYLWNIRYNASLWGSVFFSLFVEVLLSTLRMVPSSLKGEQPEIYPLDEISAAKFAFVEFSRFLEVFFLNFVFHLGIFNGISSNIYKYLLASISLSVLM